MLSPMVSTNFLTGTCQKLKKPVEEFFAFDVHSCNIRTSVVEVIRRTLNARMSSVCCILIRKFSPRSKDVMIL